MLDCTSVATTGTTHDSGVVTANVLTAKPTPSAGFAKLGGSPFVLTSASIAGRDLPNVDVLISTSAAVSDLGNSADYQFNNASGALTVNVPGGCCGIASGYFEYGRGQRLISSGTLSPGGALGDALCPVSDATNHQYDYVQKGITKMRLVTSVLLLILAGSLAAQILCPVPGGFQPITIGAHVATDNDTTSATTVVVNITPQQAGTTLVCDVKYHSNANIVSVKGAVNGLFQLGADLIRDASHNYFVTGTFYKENVSASAETVTLTYTVPGPHGQMACKELQGVQYGLLLTFRQAGQHTLQIYNGCGASPTLLETITSTGSVTGGSPADTINIPSGADSYAAGVNFRVGAVAVDTMYGGTIQP